MLQNNRFRHLVLALIHGVIFSVAAQNIPIQQALNNASGMKWRAIGPANMGGRVTDIVGVPGDPSTFYFAGADGGVFKTTNGGVTCLPINALILWVRWPLRHPIKK